MILEDGPLFIADTHVNAAPSPEQIAETVVGAVRHANVSASRPRSRCVRIPTLATLTATPAAACAPRWSCWTAARWISSSEGEMSIDAALDPDLRHRIFPNSRMAGPANILVFAFTDAANTARNMLKMKAGGLEVGPI